VIGIGSPHGDDRIGWEAIDALAASGLPDRFSAETFCCDRLGAGLLRLFEGVKAAIVIDAMKSGCEPGTLRKLDSVELLPECGLLSSHGIGVAETIGLGRMLGLLPQQLVLYGIEVCSVVPESMPDPRVRTAFPALRAAILEDLENLNSNHEPRVR